MGRTFLVRQAAAAALIGCLMCAAVGASAQAWAGVGEGPLRVAQAPGPGSAVAQAAEGQDHKTTALLGSELLFDLVHAAGIIGGAGLVVALLLQLVRLWSAPPPRRRRSLLSAHAALAVVFGVLAMTHGTILFFHELLEGDWKALIGAGTWLCTFTFLMVVSGIGRRYDRKRVKTWVKLHRSIIWLWAAAAAWHLIAELL